LYSGVYVFAIRTIEKTLHRRYRKEAHWDCKSVSDEGQIVLKLFSLEWNQ
jgi:hypothetical protein